jgi:Putative prokaryotic signal transducing protein
VFSCNKGLVWHKAWQNQGMQGEVNAWLSSGAGPNAWQHQAQADMKRLQQAPNLALATLWADQLQAAGISASVQRAYASGIAGQMPPDQCLPEVWVDEEQFSSAQTLMHTLQHLPHHTWACRACHEIVEGPFEQCWNCGAERLTAAVDERPHAA